MLFPNIAKAQDFNIFAKQKVVIADIRDMNDRPLSDALKTAVRQNIVDACVKSEEFEVFEVNMDDIRQQIIASGQTPSFASICKAIGSRADFIVFTDIKASTSSFGSQDIAIHITSSLYRISTASEVLVHHEQALPTSQSILEATSKLISKLLGINEQTLDEIQASDTTDVDDANEQNVASASASINDELPTTGQTTNQVPFNEIWYTAAKKVEPYNTDAFGVQIISHTWDSISLKGVITFDGDVTLVGDYAFYSEYWKNGLPLISISFPECVTHIGKYAFHNCPILTTIDLPKRLLIIGEYAFMRCYSLDNLVIPDGVHEIKHGAFWDCSSLTSVTIPDSVVEIGNQVFQSCDSLHTVRIGKNVKYIGYSTFAFCPSLSKFEGKFASSDGRCLVVNHSLRYFATANLRSYTIPNGITRIDDRAFAGCCLKSITIPNSVSSIEYTAFYDCENIEEFNGAFATDDGKCLIEDGTLIAFAIGANITDFTIPSSVHTIGAYVFRFCDSIRNITIPHSVEIISSGAFMDCTNLSSIHILGSDVKIRKDIFYRCESLKGIYCHSKTPPIISVDDDDNLFYGIDNAPNIYVPHRSVRAYKKAVGWSDYAENIVGYNF